MRPQIFLTTLLISCFSATAFAQQAKLEGRVVDDKNRPVSGVRIRAAGGQAAVTDIKGHFKIFFPTTSQPGHAARVVVVKPNWVIYQPMFGKCVTQNSEVNFEPLQVVIVRKGTLLALSPKRISEVVAEWANERNNYARENESLRSELNLLSQNRDEYDFLRKYAAEYGFTLETFIAAADRWARLKVTDDKKERALQEYWLKRYDVAARLALEAAAEAELEMDRTNQQRREASRRFILVYLIAGGSLQENDKFDEALDALLKIERAFESGRLDKETFANERTKIGLFVANLKIAVGKRKEGAEQKRLLLEAAATIDQYARFYANEESSRDRGFVQERLGDAMFALGELASGEESVAFLNRAVTAYATLESFTKQEAPQEWALSLSKLGMALGELGRKTGGADGVRYLERAAAAMDDALTIFEKTQPHHDHNWATARNNLGNIMQAVGMLKEGKESIDYLSKAVAAYDAALTVMTQQQSPEDWARIHYNLGNTLLDLGGRTVGPESIVHLRRSVAEYRLALTVRTLQQSPQLWLKTQHDLGLAYIALKDLRSTSDVFESILAAYPDNEEAYYRATAINHQSLFNFEKAFALNQRWLASHKGDLGSQFVFAESNFTTARFTECLQLCSTLLADPEIPVPAKIPLRAIEIACLLALKEPGQVSGKLDVLIAEVAGQPPEYRVGWSCDGTRYFIEHSDILLGRRVWLTKLLDVTTSQNRDELLKGLREVKAEFKE